MLDGVQGVRLHAGNLGEHSGIELVTFTLVGVDGAKLSGIGVAVHFDIEWRFQTDVG